jgi:hypothetical protein
MGIDGHIVFDGALSSMVGAHGSIPKVKGSMELYDNRLEDPVPPIDVVFDVGLTPTILVGIKWVGRESATLGTTICKINFITPNVETLIVPKGVVL